MSMRKLQDLDTAALYRLAYGAYEHLRDHPETAADSNTARLIRAGDGAQLRRRAAEELRELAGVLRGSHAGPLLLEAVQAWYWLALGHVLAGDSYEAFAPLEALQDGYERCDAAPLDVAAELEAAAEHTDSGAALEAIGAALALQRTASGEPCDPRRLVLGDLESMGTRPYLRPYFESQLP